MKARNFLASLVAVIALALLLVPNVAAFADINSVYIDGIFYQSGETAGVTAGNTMSVGVKFTATEDIKDVRINARILGENSLSASTERFDVISGSAYRKTVNIDLPYDINPDEEFTLEVTIESRNDGIGAEQTFLLRVQRSNNDLEILSVESDDQVSAGETLALDVVLKNRGRHQADDAFVEAVIPALGIKTKVYFGDLSEVDQPVRDNSSDRLNKEDTVERMLYLSIPSGIASGVYDIELTAFNDDALTTVVKRIVINGGTSENSNVFISDNSEKVNVGETAEYTMTIVNSGNNVKVYELILDADEGLNVDFSNSIVAVPAGSSKVVKITAEAGKEGNYNFAVNLHSDGALVQTENFKANVEGKTSAANAAVVLTIILAIIFVVLLIVLIVLLTRKPKTNEEFGESYY